MINILVIGDPHFKNDNANDMTEMSHQTITIASSLKPDFIVVLGDVLDTKDRIHLTPLLLATKWLKELENICPLYVIVGNHDRRHDKIFLTDEHPFTAFKYWTNTTIVDHPMIIKMYNYTFLMVPYVEPGRFKEALDLLHDIDYQHVTCVFCHQEFKGVQMGPVQSIHGDEWSSNMPYVISGHIHEYQKLQNNILYMGTPIQHRHSDTVDKYIGFFTFTKSPAHHDDYQCQLISLNFPKKIKFYLNYDEFIHFKLPKDCHPQLIITGNESEIKSLLKLPKLATLRKQGIKVIYNNKHNVVKSSLLPVLDKNNKSFSDLLYEKIKSDKNLTMLYREIFSI
ncbi:MAG TPA: metallophosphoesterase [Candidatus Saccharimonadales bacterium]|nr:metallophosphoesterase [Candidatus Saccharimonadales bacterium]